MKYIAIIEQSIYGTSGTELAPPIESRNRFGYISEDGETLLAFNDRIRRIVLPLRNEPAKSYSWSDGYDWTVAEVKGIS